MHRAGDPLRPIPFPPFKPPLRPPLKVSDGFLGRDRFQRECPHDARPPRGETLRWPSDDSLQPPDFDIRPRGETLRWPSDDSLQPPDFEVRPRGETLRYPSDDCLQAPAEPLTIASISPGTAAWGR